MSRYDGLIIPRSYSEYINKTDAATLQQALQLSGVLSGTVAAGDNKAVKSDAVNTALSVCAKSLFIGQSNNTYYYKVENFLNRTLMLSDSIGNVWLLVGNSGGVTVTKISQRNTTSEIFKYDSTNRIMYIKVLTGYGFYFSILANPGNVKITQSTDSTEFDNITNVITEVNLITG